jgi:hypothetical protein
MRRFAKVADRDGFRFTAALKHEELGQDGHGYNFLN